MGLHFAGAHPTLLNNRFYEPINTYKFMKLEQLYPFFPSGKSIILNMMRLVFLLFFTVSFGFTPVNGLSQNKKINLHNDKTLTVDEVFDLIEEQTPYRFVYQSSLIKNLPEVDIEKGPITVKELLENSISNVPLTYMFKNEKDIVLSKNDEVIGDNAEDEQQQDITGVVTDDKGTPIAGVNITVEGTSKGTSTDFDGAYAISADQGETLVFSSVGFKDQSMTISDDQEINITMEDSKSSLEEVLVTAYGASSRESITGSISSINAEDFEDRAMTSVFSALEGSAPGIQFGSNSGMPGSTGSIRLRGFTSLNGSNSPLIVMDGVPYSGSRADINPQDVESISVLKDASATALYGNKASNGVIIIETKSAKPGGKGSMNISVKQGFFERSLPDYDLLDSDDFMETMWAGYRNSLMSGDLDYSMDKANTKASEDLIGNHLKYNIYNAPDDELFTEDGKLNSGVHILPGYLDDLDWFKGIERTGYRQEYSVSARTASDKGGVYYSLGYLDEEGYVKTSEMNRLNARINAHYQANDWLKYGANLSGTLQKTKIAGSSSSKNPFLSARDTPPIYPVHRHDPETGEYILDADGNKEYDIGEGIREIHADKNMIWENELSKDRKDRSTMRGTAYIDIDFLEDFTFTAKADLSSRKSTRQRYTHALFGSGETYNGRSREDMSRKKNITAQQLLNWDRQFDNHNFEVLLGHENYRRISDKTLSRKDNEIFPNKSEFRNFTELYDIDGYKSEYTSEGYFSRLKYNFDRKYYLEGSFRRDGSSKFSKKKRWGNFWSVGGSWILTREDFFQYDFVDDLKFRASYGEVGNDSGAASYAYQSLYSIRQNDNIAALYLSQLGAVDLIWETSTQFGTGLEGRLFDRANFTVEFFDKRSKNLLFDIRLPVSSGATSTSSAKTTLTKNLGTISNTGFELGFDVDVLKNKDWLWNVGVTATSYKNKIVRLPEENRENGIISGNKKRVEGGSIYDFFTYKYVGVDQMTGNALYLPDTETFNIAGSNPDGEDVPEENIVEIDDEYYVNTTTYGRKDWAGTSIPKVYGSVRTSLDWKGFTLSGLLNYNIGGKVYDSAYRSLMTMSGRVHAIHKDNLQAWNGVPEGMTNDSPDRIDPNGIPVVDYNRSSNNNESSDRWLKNGTYFTLKNITLSYNLPQNLIQKLGFSSLNVFATGENLKTFTSMKGMNPQSFSGGNNHQYVPYRTYTLGVNIGI